LRDDKVLCKVVDCHRRVVATPISGAMSMTPTMAEREAELSALQSAFDEYIASSRELEEELDAELAKMRT
jgi:hypothetical protein